MRLYVLFFCLLVYSACNNIDSSATTGTPSVEVANTPQAVAQYWLEQYFDNEFAAARPYSTLATQSMIDTIEKVIFTDLEEKIVFKITALQCATQEVAAKCTYVYVEGTEKIPETIQLKKVNGQWLVDAQLIQDDGEFLEEMEEELLQELQ